MKIAPELLNHFRIGLRGDCLRFAWSDLAKDLVEVGTRFAIADRLAAPPSVGVRVVEMGSLPVRQVERWREAETLLRGVLEILAPNSTFEFSFCSNRPSGVGFPKSCDRSLIDELPVTSAMLFSGGLDSTAALPQVLETGESPVLVTQYARGIRRIELLAASLGRSYAARPLVHAKFFVTPIRITHLLRNREWRLRPFLFSALALSVCHTLKLPRLMVCENGPLAWNLPWHTRLSPTRHAHPVYLARLEAFAQSLFQTEIRVDNPAGHLTKGEMASRLADQPRLALQSQSCWGQQWAGKRQCGSCVPCVIRRVALEHAGIRIPPQHFETDIAKLYQRMDELWPAQRGSLGAWLNLVDFCGTLARECKRFDTFWLTYAEYLELGANPVQELSREQRNSAHQTYSRFAQEVLALERKWKQ